MSDEKVKPIVLGKVEIIVFTDGNVSVVGPVDNPVVMLDIFGKAMGAVARHVATLAGENGIVVP